MRLLVDSHVALWWLSGDSSLGPKCIASIIDATEVRFSAVTPWELGIKKALGKIDYPDGLVAALEDTGFNPLDITSEHAERAVGLPAHHRDPFDRMLIAQSRVEELTIVTADKQFNKYDALLLSARE